MMITIHLILLGAVIATPLVAIASSPTITAGRPVRTLCVALVPFLIVGVLSGLLMSAAGKPHREWLLPMCGFVAVWCFCRSDKIYRRAKSALLVLMVVLVVNYLGIIGGGRDYTGDARTSRSMLRHQPVRIVPLWHTPMTGLHKIERSGVRPD